MEHSVTRKKVAVLVVVVVLIMVVVRRNNAEIDQIKNKIENNKQIMYDVSTHQSRSKLSACHTTDDTLSLLSIVPNGVLYYI